jgi:hypothetical protein
LKQGQLATARQLARAADPGRQLLQVQVLEMEDFIQAVMLLTIAALVVVDIMVVLEVLMMVLMEV